MRGDKRKILLFVSTLQKKHGHAWEVFWLQAGTSKRARIVFFKSLIPGTLYSRLETMVMSPAEYKRLDVCILGFVRKLMRGAATSKKQLQIQA